MVAKDHSLENSSTIEKTEKQKHSEHSDQKFADLQKNGEHYRAAKTHSDKSMAGLSEHLLKTGQLPSLHLVETTNRSTNTTNRTSIEHSSSLTSRHSQTEGSPERHLEQGTHNRPSTRQQEWTVCVNLTANERNDDGSDAGGKPKLKQLQELASQTAGKNVTIIAQSFTTNEAGERMVQRYIIKDGKCTPMYVDANGHERPIKSEGYKQDLQNLLRIANDNHPSKKIALIQQGHGMPDGTLGIENPTDHRPGQLNGQNSCTIQEFRDAVRQGLHGRKLDLLDFDACHMGSEHVLNNVSGITKQVVASPETEQHNGGQGGFDGQNIGSIVRTVLNHPELNGDQLGKTIVDNANRGSNRGYMENQGNHEGTDTLSHYNLEKYTTYRNAVNEFGRTLAEIANNPTERALLRKIIEQTPTYPAGDSASSTRDVKRFAELVRNTIGHGLSDPEGRLSRSIETLLKSERELVAQYHANQRAQMTSTNDQGQTSEVSRRAEYEKMGGLSIYLPSHDANDRARVNTPLAQIRETVSLGLQHPESREDTKRFLAAIAQSPSLRQSFSPGSAEEQQLTQLNAALKQVQAKDCSAASLSELNKVLESLKGSKLEAAFQAASAEQARKVMRKQLQENCDADEHGWQNFLQKMGLAG